MNIIYRRELAAAEDPVAKKTELADEYRETFANPFRAAQLGYIDAVIHPRETRQRIVSAFELLKDKVDTNPRKKHGNIPL